MQKPTTQSTDLINAVAFFGCAAAERESMAKIADVLIGGNEEKLRFLEDILSWAKIQGEQNENYNSADFSGE